MIKSPKRRSGISRPEWRYVRKGRAYVALAGAIALLAVLALGLSWGMYDAGRKFAGFDKNETDLLIRSAIPVEAAVCSEIMTNCV